MKILFVTCWYPEPNHPGSGIFIKEHARAIALQGHDIRILHFNFVPGKKFYRCTKTSLLDDKQVMVYKISIESRFWKIFYHWLTFQKIIIKKYFNDKIFKEFQPDLIHANVLFPAGIISSFLSKRLKLPFVLSEHWSGVEKMCRHPLFGFQAREALKNADRIMPVSGFLAGNILKLVKDPKRITVVPNIVDSQIFKPKSPGSTNEPGRSLNFLIVANWDKRRIDYKRPVIVFEALKLFSQEYRGKIVLRVVGEGALIEPFRLASGDYPFEIRFEGFVSKDKLSEFLKEADFFLHASDYETFSVVTAEALAVVVSDLPALRELVNDENGVLVKNDAKLWADAISKALSINWDRDSISRNIAQKFSYPSIGAQFTGIYRELNVQPGEK